MSPSVSAFSQGLGDTQFYPSATFNPPAPANPWVPTTSAGAAGLAGGAPASTSSGATPTIPLIGLLLIGALLILMHHLHLRASAGAGGSV